MNELDRRQFPQTRDESDRRAAGLACLPLLDLEALDVRAIRHSDFVSVALVDSCRLTQWNICAIISLLMLLKWEEVVCLVKLRNKQV